MFSNSCGALTQGHEFYINLLRSLENRYRFRLDHYYDDIHSGHAPGLGRSGKLALYSAHIALLCLGDLARYKEQMYRGNSYAKAKE